ncbi:MAG: amidohydrolase family protein [Desulfobulbaceae bacterium]|nr:amidohydrolase family protein [Desulfobulbaceae bacterium]
MPALHSAAWVVPVSAAPIANGAVVTAAGKIVDVGTLEVLSGRYPHAPHRHHTGAALTPALINAHTHLELSHLSSLSRRPHQGTFTGWVSQLIALRLELGATGVAAEQAAIQSSRQQYENGVSVLADIGNTDLALGLVDIYPGRLLSFHEYLGLTPQSLTKNRDRLALEPATRLCSGHAPYSTHPALLSALKKRAKRLGQVFPIHVAEPMAELDMLRHGRGEMVDFILVRTGEEIVFQAAIGPEEGSIHYLYRLGLLDERTLCIHGIHVSDAEMTIMADTGAKVCICPHSNHFLGVGSAPVQRYLQHGILPALGTDSPASNPELSLWQEMHLLASAPDAPDAATIFAMATLGGALALGLDDQLGSLEPGKEADILVVPLDTTADSSVSTAADLMKVLTSRPRQALNQDSSSQHTVSRIAL